MNDWYRKLLDHPKWKRKRAKILKRDNYKCTECKSTVKLSVHHTFYYDKFINPWLYPEKSLLTLCDKCHFKYHSEHEVEIRPYPKSKKSKRKAAKKARKKKKIIPLVKIQAKQGIRVKKKNGDIIILP